MQYLFQVKLQYGNITKKEHFSLFKKMCPAWLYHSGISMHFLCIPIPMHQVALGYSHIIRSKSYGITIAYGIILS